MCSCMHACMETHPCAHACMETHPTASSSHAGLQLHLDSGPLFRFGAFHFEGLRQVRPDAVMALRNVRPGDPLLEQALLNYQDRLVRTGLFDTVAVTYDPDPQQAAATPIQVRVRERILQQATVGVGVSDLSGPRVTTSPQVMSGATSSGQQVCTGNRPRSTSVPS